MTTTTNHMGEALICAFAFLIGGPVGLFWTAGVLFACNVLFTWQEGSK